jgi:hypothetical protein
MAKTYLLKALWPLLPFEVAPAPLQATFDTYRGGLVKYAASPDEFWFYSLAELFNEHESVGLTGYHPADLSPKQIDGVEGYFHGLRGGLPLLAIPFTVEQLTKFKKRTGGLIESCIERGSETDAWIAELQKNNPDAAELAKGIRTGKWPVDLATPVVLEDTTHGEGIRRIEPSWTLTKPHRFQGYSKPLYDYLNAAHVNGKVRPTARDVLDNWKMNKPYEVAEVSNDGLKYYDAIGNTKPADLVAIRKVIGRLSRMADE